MTPSHVALAILVALAAVGAVAIADRLGRISASAWRRRAQRAAQDRADADPAVDRVAALALGTGPAVVAWVAMPCGTRREYGSTGWWIELIARRDVQPFRVWSPEGTLIAIGGDLQGLKRLAERLAGDRDEFKPRPATALRWIDPPRDP